MAPSANLVDTRQGPAVLVDEAQQPIGVVCYKYVIDCSEARRETDRRAFRALVEMSRKNRECPFPTEPDSA
jgi:hypothetical protein